MVNSQFMLNVYNSKKGKLIGLFSFAIVLLSVINVSAQSKTNERYFDERYIYTQAFLNPVLVNPGATGFSGGHQLLLNYRNKWSGHEGSPTTMTLSYDGTLVDRLGIGLILMQDNFGALTTNKGQMSFAYNVKSDINNVSFGLSTEFVQHVLNNRNASDLILDPLDPLLGPKREGTRFFDASFGVHGVYDGKFTYGLALPSLISSRIDFTNKENYREMGFLLHLGYRIMSEETGISIEPSIMLKKLNFVPTHVDLNAKFGFLEDRFTGGFSYTIGADKRVGFLIGANIDKFDVFYTYNISTYEFQTYNNGSHEVTARFRFGNDGVLSVGN